VPERHREHDARKLAKVKDGGLMKMPHEASTSLVVLAVLALGCDSPPGADVEPLEARVARAAPELQLHAVPKVQPARRELDSANDARSVARSSREKEQAETAVSAARSAVGQTQSLLARLEGCSRKPKGFAEDLATLRGAVDGLEATLAGLDYQLAAEDFLGAHDTAQHVASQAEALTLDLDAASEMLKCGALPRFPWPPPEPSASAKVPRDLLVSEGEEATLRLVSARLERAFERSGYGRIGYHWVPGGFALVSQLEQVQADGRPRERVHRWQDTIAPIWLGDLISYIKALFSAPIGHYRVVVFVATSRPFGFRAEPVATAREMEGFLKSGFSVLPASTGDIVYTENHYCTALIYQFEKRARDSPASFIRQSSLTGKEHLAAAGLWNALEVER
jgi:hypothetical protein